MSIAINNYSLTLAVSLTPDSLTAILNESKFDKLLTVCTRCSTIMVDGDKVITITVTENV